MHYTLFRRMDIDRRLASYARRIWQTVLASGKSVAEPVAESFAVDSQHSWGSRRADSDFVALSRTYSRALKGAKSPCSRSVSVLVVRIGRRRRIAGGVGAVEIPVDVGPVDVGPVDVRPVDVFARSTLGGLKWFILLPIAALPAQSQRRPGRPDRKSARGSHHFAERGSRPR
jgi:hypothetical protein